jgi:hypothetical protein
MPTRNVKLSARIRYGMEDSESDTIVIKNWPEKYTDILNQIGDFFNNRGTHHRCTIFFANSHNR